MKQDYFIKYVIQLEHTNYIISRLYISSIFLYVLLERVAQYLCVVYYDINNTVYTSCVPETSQLEQKIKYICIPKDIYCKNILVTF